MKGKGTGSWATEVLLGVLASSQWERNSGEALKKNLRPI
jgi:hypothetical protein